MGNKFKVLKDVPLNMGRGEGGGTLPKLYGILQQIDRKLYELEQKVNEEQEKE